MSSSASVSNAGKPGSGSSWPSKRTIGGRPAFRWTSLAPRSTAALRILSRSIVGSVKWLSASELDGWQELGEWKRAGQSVRARRRECDRRELERAALSCIDAPVDADHRPDDEGARDAPDDVSGGE